MILVKLEGGLGNQMFQYALAKKLSLKLNTEILLDINLYTKDIALTHPRSYGLSHLNIKAKIATDKEIKNIRYRYGILIHKLFRRFESIVLQKKHIKFEKSIFNKSGDISLEGFWQSEKYFKDIREILLKDFTLKNQLSSSSKELKLKISNEQNSVSLHVRRTDYVANEHNIRFYGSHCNQEYYTKALSMICNKINTDNIHVFIFSDEIKWVKENLEIPYEKTYIS